MSIYNVFLGYGGKKLIKLVVASDTTNYNLLSAAQATGQYAAGRTKVEVTVNPGVTVSSSSTGLPAMNVAGFASGDEVVLVNNGRIQGAGGNGGNSGDGRGNATNGAGGGNAINVGYSISITNNGLISGGGGGGGGAPGYNYNTSCGWGQRMDNWTRQGGGGGGAGRTVGAGGSGNGNGSAGSLDTGGAGSWNAGRGGDTGQNGAQFGVSTFNVGGYGGAAGRYVQGNSLVSWNATGDRRGNVS